jgi:hypothetical protein
MPQNIFQTILPAHIDNTIRGVKLPLYVFALFAVVSTVRSVIHLLSPDGGAGSIAGMDLSVAGADGIIFAFGLWVRILANSIIDSGFIRSPVSPNA